MDSRRRFRPRLSVVEPAGDRGTKQGRPCGRPFKAVGGGDPAESRAREQGGDPALEPSGVDTREKPAAEPVRRPYRKPTQVGEASSLR